MKRFKHWLEHKGIHCLFAISLLILGVLVFRSYSPTRVPVPGEEQVVPLPWVADLCMAYIGAYFFHYLVVALPGKRKQASRLLTLEMPLKAIANNGRDMIRHLERIASCPPRRITVEHLTKVLTAVNNNEHIKAHIAYWLAHSQAAYKELVPYAADLPLDLQECLQKESQNFLYMSFPRGDAEMPNNSVSIQDLRAVVPQNLLTGGKLVYKRETLAGYARIFMDYYKATEAVRLALAKYEPPRNKQLEDDGTKPGQLFFLYGIERERYWTYPDEATSELLPNQQRMGDRPLAPSR